MSRISSCLASAAGLAALTATGVAGAAGAAGAADELSEMAKQIESLRQANEKLTAKVAKLEEHADSEQWLTEARAAEIRGIVTDVLADSATRSSLLADASTAGWDKSKGGFFIESADGNYRLNIRGQVQVRFVYDSREIDGIPAAPTADQWGFEIRRLRLNFGGHVIDPSWTYLITPVWGRIAAGNLVGSANGGLDNAWIRKDLGDGFGVKIGQFQPLYAREESVSSAQQQAVERSTLNEAFSVRYSQGIQLEYGGRKEDSFRAALFYGDGLRAGAVLLPTASGQPAGTYGGTVNTNFNANMAEYAFCGRVEYLGGGSWNLMRDFSSFRGAGSGWLLGFGAMSQEIAPPTIAPLAATTTDSMWAVLADANFKFDGSSLYFGGFYRNVSLAGDVAVRGGGFNDGMNQFGAIVQGGVFVADTVELFARYEYGNSGIDQFRTTQPDLDFETSSILTVGCNWFISGDHAIKWTNDLGYGFAPMGDFNAPGAEWLVDTATTNAPGRANDGQWVFRSQLQFLF